MFVIMALPVLAAFESIAGNTSIVTWVVMTIYTFDSIVSFNLLSIKDGEIATDLKITRRNYMYKMLLFDVITTIPFDAIFQSTWSQSETLLITHVPRAAFRLFSCIQNNPYFVLLGKTFLQTFQLGASFMSMFFLGGLLVVYIHLHACTYFLVGRWTNFSSSTWGLLDSVLKSPAGNQYSWAIFSAMGNTFPITGFK